MVSFEDYKDEQGFKRAYIREVLSLAVPRKNIFEIETEETFLGFPDVMLLENTVVGQVARFFEFKYSDKTGHIKFQPTQPAFYKQHPDMSIRVIAYNKATGKVHTFMVSELFDKDSVYHIDSRATVNLNRREHENESTNC